MAPGAGRRRRPRWRRRRSIERDGQSFDAASFARIPQGSGQTLTYEDLPDGKLPPGQVAPVVAAEDGTTVTINAYPETNLVVTRKEKDGVMHDVELDCYGTLDGWQPLGSSGEIEYTRIDLVRGNSKSRALATAVATRSRAMRRSGSPSGAGAA